MDPLVERRLRRLARALVYAVVVAVPIAVLAYLVRSGFEPLVRLDESVNDAATGTAVEHATFLDALLLWEDVSQPWVVYLLVGVPACLWAWRRHHLTTRALWAAVTMVAGWLIAVLLKLAVQRARPEMGDPFAHHSGYSFPSGHATNNAVLVTAVLLLVWPVLGVAARRAWTLVGVAWVALTCADRLFLGAHFLSDVLAGVLLGAGLVGASYAGYQGWSPPKPGDQPDTPTRGAR